MLHSLPTLDQFRGTAAAMEVYHEANRLLKWAAPLAPLSCQWNRMTNHVLFAHYPQLLGGDARFTVPCPPGLPRIFVYDVGEVANRPLSCSRTGFWASEVYIHRFLRHSACRVHRWQHADFFFVPAYLTCWELLEVQHKSAEERAASAAAISSRIRKLPHWHRRGGHDHIFLFGNAEWLLEGWRKLLRMSVILAVETNPIDCTDASADFCYTCEDCFQPWKDFAVPPVTTQMQVRFLLRKSLPTEDRTLVMSFHGQHANVADEKVRKVYRRTKETVRLKILDLAHLPNVSLGGPVANYGEVLGDSHFCLCPKGASSYTSRVFEALFAGCIPVILSDHMRLPFDTIVDWSKFSIRWPMDQVDEALYTYLRGLIEEHPDTVAAMKREVAAVRCWFDYFAVVAMPLECSPYLAILRSLAEKAKSMPRMQPPFGPSNGSKLPSLPSNIRI
eukprot:gnl/TRDRNA2_/TRDRNA2_177347_c0_seq1.p1 gnl/TRDRNA2_/TRDRNA2_177347_c0~~gnl/TRDRNA2_/TRDRNA2_177347_c0_seq1.p1  ORF type:complete len:463 (+),score=48.69 gnl/TRDRNA2_/TRDRNA2_177347_c0_seq1:54-1391(+)